jgi:hypothetical protein
MDHVVITVPAGRPFRGVLRLVVGGIGSRCGLSFDHVDELQLAVDSLLDHRNPAHDTIELEAAIGDEEVVLVVGPFMGDGDLAGRRVTTALVDRARTIDRDGFDWIELSVTMPTQTQAGA